MKLTLILLTAALLNVQASAVSQKISFSGRNAALKDVFAVVKSQTSYVFVYKKSLVADAKKVTLSVKDVELNDFLESVFKDQPFTYAISGNTIVIRELPAGPPKEKETTVPDRLIASITDVADIKVVVTGEGGIPLTGATVTIKGTNRRFASDASGGVVLTKVDDKTTLVISYSGYRTREVTLKKGELVISVRLEVAIDKIDDMVVTGIFNKHKDTYTGAERTITAQELRQFQGRNLFTTIGNIDPSFYVLPNNASGSDPNRVPDVQIRGTRSLPNIDQLQDQTAVALNTPLIILDNFETNLQRMMDLDNNQILSITLLKDGSATAIYGSRGANGVIVIKTKEPVAGSLRLTYRGTTNLNAPDLSSYNLLNSADKLELERLSGFYQSSTMTPEANIGLQQYYNQVLALVAKGVNTDWLSIPLRTKLDHSHSLKVEGGDQTFRYDLSLQYNRQNGVMRKSSRNTFNGTINLSYKYNNLTFRNTLMVGQAKGNESPYGSFADYAKLNPYWQPYDASGKVVKYFSPYNYAYSTFGNNVGKPFANPLYDATLRTYNVKTYTSITDNFQLEWRPLEGLYLRGGIGVTSISNYLDDFKPAEHSKFAGYSDADIFRKGTYDYASGKDFNYTGNFAASYFKLFSGIHAVSAGINLDVSESNEKYYTFNLEGFPDESIDFLSMALQYQQNGKPGGFESSKRRVGALGNLSYALRDRYLADFSYRLDGASQFGVDRRFAPFWSAGIGWNVHYESFMKYNLPFVDRLKLRGSYGSTGTTQFDAYQALGTYSYITNDRYKTWLGARQNSLGNPNLAWQQTKKYNAGFEMDLFKKRITLEADIYRERTSNLLSSLELPYANGFTSYNENIGQLESKGFELAATVWVIRSTGRRFSWSLTGNMVYNQDEIIALSQAMKAANIKLQAPTGLAVYNQNKIIREGASQNTIYAVRSLGIDPSTGKELYLNKDGQVTYLWNPADRVASGVEQPKYRGNFSTLVRYGNFTFNASFGFRFGGQIYNQTLVDKIENADRQMNVDQRVFTDRWKKPGDVTFFRGINETLKVYPSSRFVQDENTLTCQNININYDVNNRRFLKRLGMESLNVSGNTGELFYVSTVHQERGTAYPFTRQFTLSIFAAFKK